jgi:hypothetical protein
MKQKYCFSMLLTALLLTACGRTFNTGGGPATTPVNQGQLTSALATQAETQLPNPSDTPLSTMPFTTKTVEAKPLPKATANSLSSEDNLIYIQDRFNTGIYFYSYPTVNKSSDYLPPNQVIAFPGENSPGPGNLSFANFEPKLAYADLRNNIWIADLMNHNPKKITSFPYDYKGNIRLIWSPDDRYLLIDTNDPILPNMIYSINEGELEGWDYICDRMATSPRTKQISVWCISSNDSNDFAILEWGGTIWYSDQAPENEFLRSTSTDGQINESLNIFSLYNDVGWSSDGAYIAYFDPQDKNGTLTIARLTGEIQSQIPQKAYWLSDLFSNNNQLPGTPIQWSKNNEYILVYAMGDSNSPCPTPSVEELKPFPPQKTNSACWQVLNSKTGVLIWDTSRLEQNNQPDFKHTDSSMSISPDGEMVALASYINGFDPVFYVVDVRENNILLQAPFTVDKMRWGPKITSAKFVIPTTSAFQPLTCQGPDQTSSQMTVPGVIAYQDNSLGKFATIGGSPWITSTLPIPGRYGEVWQSSLIGFSPDGEWLAYRPYRENDSSQLTFLTSGGAIKRTVVNYKKLLSFMDWPDPFFSGFSTYTWINQQLLHAEVWYQEDADIPWIHQFEGILDQASGRWMEPLFYGLPGSEYRSTYQRPLDVIYSPDLSLVLFPPTNLGYGLMLWDLTNKKELSFDKDWGGGGGPYIGLYAAWAPDSSKVAYIRLSQSSRIDDLIVLDRNGQQFDIQSPFQSTAGFTNYLSWSPDNRYLAFSVLREENPLGTETLLVYDSESQKITLQCLLEIDRNRYHETNYYWSPDSRFLTYSMALTQPIHVIDTKTGRIDTLPVTGVPFGWSDKFQVLR